jgi:hypothetical protein
MWLRCTVAYACTHPIHALRRGRGERGGGGQVYISVERVSTEESITNDRNSQVERHVGCNRGDRAPRGKRNALKLRSDPPPCHTGCVLVGGRRRMLSILKPEKVRAVEAARFALQG